MIHVSFDTSVNGAPAGFQAAIDYAVSFLNSKFTDPTSVNIDVGYGEVGGTALDAGALGESSTYIRHYSYAQVRSALAADARSSVHASTLASLPSADPTA